MFHDPDFKQYKSSCDLDYARFFIDRSAPVPKSLEHARITPAREGGSDAMMLTIQDPKPSDFVAVETAYPTAQFATLEVFFELKPKKSSTPVERNAMLQDIQQWIVSHLYPWRGKGLQVATRVSKGKRHVAAVFNDPDDSIERRPMSHETMYFGHSKGKYADPSFPNYAFLRMYIKKTDQRLALLPDEWRTRLEVNLNHAGCIKFGLTTPTSIFGFNFRGLGEYFHFFKPGVTSPIYKKMRKRNPKMAALLESTRKRMATDTLREAGAHTGSREKLINLDGHHRHPKANKMIRDRLDDLTAKYCKKDPKSRYGSEWGSW